MIRLAGSAKRSFLFPSDLTTALQYYANMGHLFQYLPHITLIKTYSKTQFRVLYNSIELGIYKIKLYCDLEVRLDSENATIEVGVLDGKMPVKTKAGMHSIRAMAEYNSISYFKMEGDHVRIYYHLNLKGQIPKPLAFSLVPDSIAGHIAEGIAKRRIFEIADGFITSSLIDFKRRRKRQG
jgi:hypothetical protein